MTSMFRFTLAAALLAGAAFAPALAAEIKPVIHSDTASVRAATSARPLPSSEQAGLSTTAGNNAQAGLSDMGNNAAPNTQMATNATPTVDISSTPSPTERKAAHMTRAQERRADAAEAETTRQLNQQAAAQAASGGNTAM